MKSLYVVLVAFTILSSCKKQEVDNNLIIIEPPADRRISSDTTTTGQKLGFTIGKPASEIYANLQQSGSSQTIANLTIVGNVFTVLDSVQKRIPLYNSIWLDETISKGLSVELQFAGGKVSGIGENINGGVNRWPGSGSVYISKGDAITDVYAKLVQIKQIPAYTKLFDRISIFYKDPSKAYDSQMALSPQWYYIALLDASHYNVIHLNFKAGLLVSVYTQVFERP